MRVSWGIQEQVEELWSYGISANCAKVLADKLFIYREDRLFRRFGFVMINPPKPNWLYSKFSFKTVEEMYNANSQDSILLPPQRHGDGPYTSFMWCWWTKLGSGSWTSWSKLLCIMHRVCCPLTFKNILSDTAIRLKCPRSSPQCNPTSGPHQYGLALTCF